VLMNANPKRKISLLLVDDHELFREGLARLLQSAPEFEVIAHCASITEALEVVRRHDIDVVLLDIDLGSERGTDLLEPIQEIGFRGKVLLVTAGVNERDVPELIRKGIAGILMKNNSPALLVQGIRDAVEGKVSFDQDLLKRALDIDRPQDAEVSHSGITAREKKVLSFVFEGLTNKEIAERLQISESAVKGSLQSLFTKTGVRTRSQLVRVALEKYRGEL
jgi:two-component system, NarL family, nitrate/nitrite response regulator NarL